MVKSYYLAIGYKLGGHYEVVKVLSEDDFEILYLVKDLHMAEKFFVLKELFLSAYASRNADNSVQIMAKSRHVFEQTKRDVIAEIEVLKTQHITESPKLYGYFEENNTIYTIMEFINNSNFSVYLESNTQNEFHESVIAKVDDDENEKEKPKSTLFLKILTASMFLLIGLLYYSYNMIQKDKERAKNKSSQVVVVNEHLNYPPLEDKTQMKEEENLTSSLAIKKEEPKEIIEEEPIREEPKKEVIKKEIIQEEAPKEEERTYIDDDESEKIVDIPAKETYTPPPAKTVYPNSVVNREVEEPRYTPREQIAIPNNSNNNNNLPINVIEMHSQNNDAPNISLGTRMQ